MNIYKKTLVLEALGSPGQPWGYPGSVLYHGVENGIGTEFFERTFGRLWHPWATIGSPLGSLGVPFGNLLAHFHKKSIKNALQEGIRKMNEK